MDIYKIKFSSKAENDLNDIYDYINEVLGNHNNAKNAYQKIRDGVLSLEYFPKRYPRVDSIKKVYDELRMLTIDNYVVLYIINGGDEVIIKRILYASSNWKK